jgi:hypothetical protein
VLLILQHGKRHATELQPPHGISTYVFFSAVRFATGEKHRKDGTSTNHTLSVQGCRVFIRSLEERLGDLARQCRLDKNFKTEVRFRFAISFPHLYRDSPALGYFSLAPLLKLLHFLSNPSLLHGQCGEPQRLDLNSTIVSFASCLQLYCSLL